MEVDGGEPKRVLQAGGERSTHHAPHGAVLRSLFHMSTAPSRVTISTKGLAALCGIVGGLLAFAAAAALWRAGQTHIAVLSSQALLLLTLGVMAAVTLLAQPARMRRARVPAGRAVPHAWWPAPADPLPAIAMCAGTPIAAGATAAMLLFR